MGPEPTERAWTFFVHKDTRRNWCDMSKGRDSNFDNYEPIKAWTASVLERLELAIGGGSDG